MPLFDYQCGECGEFSEVLIFGDEEGLQCKYCGSENMTKCLSAHSSMSGATKFSMPGSGDTGCCGSAPGQAAGCAGPGSCCGKNFS